MAALVPSPCGVATEYSSSPAEILISLGIWAAGVLILTVLFRIALSIREGTLFPSSAPPPGVEVLS